jgi:hypothetical protein
VDDDELERAVGAAQAVAATLGLAAEDAEVVHRSTRIAVRLGPCDTLARVAHRAHRDGAEREVGLAGLLVSTDAPVAGLDPRVPPAVHERDGFVVTLWTFHEHEPLATPPAAYAEALVRLHEGYAAVELPGAIPFTERVAEARAFVEADTVLAPEDRALLLDTLDGWTASILARSHQEQLLHGEPHPGNLLATRDAGPRFIDLETCCRGPIELDLAYAPPDPPPVARSRPPGRLPGPDPGRQHRLAVRPRRRPA